MGTSPPLITIRPVSSAVSPKATDSLSPSALVQKRHGEAARAGKRAASSKNKCTHPDPKKTRHDRKKTNAERPKAALWNVKRHFFKLLIVSPGRDPLRDH